VRRVKASSRIETGSADASVIDGGDHDPRVLVSRDRVDVQVLEIVFQTATPNVVLYLDV